MSFRRRTYPEVLENILTAVTGGVAAESYPFPPPDTESAPFRHSLQQPQVADVVSVHGSRDGKPHLFRKDVDYKLLDDKQTLEWQEGAQLPDPGTLVHINYYPASAQALLTDIHTGSVVRTLAESVGLEIARLYAELEAVYQSGFIDTATGRSLENVVALLGISRIQGGRATGKVELRRSPGSRGTINIPSGTRVMTVDGNVEYETTESVHLDEGQNSIRVVVRDLEVNDPLPADSLTVLAVPIAGIAGVNNPAPTALTTQDETDRELCTRAKNFLHGSERATLGAIKEAVARQGITADVEEVANTPGRIRIIPHAESLPPELQQRLLTAIEETRPAGVLVERPIIAKPPAKVNLELRITTQSNMLEQDLRAAQRAVHDSIEDYFARLPAKEPGSINRIIGLVLGVAGVEDVRVVSATWEDGTDALDPEKGEFTTPDPNMGDFHIVLGELHIADPNLPTRLDVVITYPDTESPPDAPAIQASLTNTLTYLNEMNASEEAKAARRELSYGKFLHSIPLPNKTGESLEAYDAGTPPELPDETTIAPYQVHFVITLETGLSRILSRATDDAYQLTPFERMSLGGVEVHPEAADG